MKERKKVRWNHGNRRREKNGKKGNRKEKQKQICIVESSWFTFIL
jgi:hypothetical protein